MDDIRLGFAVVLAAIIGAGGLSLSIKTPLLRDISDAAVKPFSYSRVQLMWWTLIIGDCYVIQYGLTGEYANLLNPYCLILLGISVSTTASAHVVDNRDT